MLDEAVEVVSDGGYSHNAEGGQEEFPDDFHAKGHAVVLCKEDIAPIRYSDTLMPIHTGLDPNLDELVDEKYGEDGG